jgi:hypothetical protein
LYYVIVACLMFAFPALSIAVDARMFAAALGPALVAKWFVFWSVGWRLFLAGVRQIAQPEYTAREILRLKSSESHLLVRELGFGNVALGVLGILSLWLPSWRPAAALAGGLFYGMAGLSHAYHQQRNRLQNVAMGSDLFATVVLLGTCIATRLGR